MKKILLICVMVSVSIMSLQAQNCAVNTTAGALIKQRLMANRNLFTRQEVTGMMNARAITYLPLTIHNVSNTSGEGATPIEVILSFVCGLNQLYADQDIQFFIHGQIRNLTSDFLDANSRTTQSAFVMLQQKVANTINLYVGRSLFYPSQGTTSFYSPNGDYIFLQQAMLSPEAKTEGHEIGHYLSLPHTFFGWEGTNAQTQYNGVNAPLAIGGVHTERVTRGASANCATAADGFCDTEADYHSTATVQGCNFTPATLDPIGAILDPDETNIMSYYEDACQTSFSTEQKAAIAMDVVVRNWATNTPPSTVEVTGIATGIAPTNNGLEVVDNSTIRLEWTPVTGATWYLLEVYGTTLPGVWIPNTNDVKYKGIVTTGNSYYDLATADLTVGAHYAWRVKALNQYSTCAGLSSYNKFEATSSIDIKKIPIAQQMSLKVNNNPITTTDIPLTIYSTEAIVGSIKIYAMDGKAIVSLAKQTINEGESMVQIPAEGISNGMYLAVIVTDRGSLQQKFVVQR